MRGREVAGAPRSALVLPRAALGSVLPARLWRRPAGPDDGELTVRGVTADPGRLSAYAAVCGFDGTDPLPVTYPHVLAFPLAMRLMTDRSFPLPVMGLVHIANEIVQLRPVGAGEPLTLRVAVGPVTPHPRGRRVELATEVLVGDEVVGTETSTYLRRGGGTAGSSGSGSAGKDGGLPDPASVTAEWRLGGDAGRRYAGVSGDHNPIHLHPLAARAFGFPTTIVHGMWTAARAAAELEGTLPDAYAYRVEFRAPVLLPATVRYAAAGSPADGWTLGVAGTRVHLTGTVTPR